MAEIVNEIKALRDYVFDIGFSRVWMATLPKVYTAGELAIRYVGGDTASETGFHFRLDREYQFVVFGTSERDCLTKVSALQRRLRGAHKLNVGESGWLTLGSFSCSPPFKAEDSNVYGVIGILQATAREARNFSAQEMPKMGGITIDVKPKPPGSEAPAPKLDAGSDRGIPGVNDDPPDKDGGKPSPTYPEKEYEIKEGNGACN